MSNPNSLTELTKIERMIMSETVEQQVAIGADELQRIQKMSQATANKTISVVDTRTHRIERLILAVLAVGLLTLMVLVWNLTVVVNDHTHELIVEQTAQKRKAMFRNDILRSIDENLEIIANQQER